MTPVLDLPDLELRPFEVGDIPELSAAVVASRTELFCFMDWAHPAYGLDDARAFIEATLIDRRAARAFDYGIFARGGELAGVVSINRLCLDHRSGNIGYWVRSSKTGNGLATAAVNAIAPYGFQALKLVRLEIVAAVANAASRRVAEKAGAQFECIARNRLLLHGLPTSAAVYSLVSSAPVASGDISD